MTDVPNHDSQVIGVAVAFNVLSTLAVGLRLVSKRLTTRTLLLEDWLLLASWAVATGAHIATALAYQWGLGRHKDTLTNAQLESFGRYILVLLICQPTTLMLSKLSLLRLLHRVFITRPFHIAVYVLSAIVLAWYVAILFADIFVCTPVQAHWDPTVGGECGDMPSLDIISPLPWIATDFAILVAPLPLVWRLRLPRTQKIGVFAIFVVGTVATVVSCVRYSSMFFDADDMTWTATTATLLTCAEAQTTVVCVAMVTCKGVFNALAGHREGTGFASSPRCEGTEAESARPSRIPSAFASPRGLSRRTSQEAMATRGFPSAFDSDPESIAEVDTISMEDVHPDSKSDAVREIQGCKHEQL